MYSASATPAKTASHAPSFSSHAPARSSCDRKTKPAAMYANAHNDAPIVSKRRKRQADNLNCPASGVTSVLKPGTNFANTNENAPYFEYAFAVRFTHESGSSEILQRSPRNLPP